LDELQTILTGDSYVAAIGNEVDSLGDSGVFNIDREVEMKVASVVFEEGESFVKFAIEGLEVIQKALLLAEPLREEEAGERDVHRDVLVQRFANDLAHQITFETILCSGIRLRIWI